MTDYQEEQANEIEALESIYPEEFTLLETTPTHSFQLPLHAEADGQAEDEVSCTLKFTYTKTYPDAAPVMEIVDPDNLTDDDIKEVENLLKEQAEENLGMVMIFTLVSAVQEKFTGIVNGIAQRREDEREEELRKIEEAGKKEIRRNSCNNRNFSGVEDEV